VFDARGVDLELVEESQRAVDLRLVGAKVSLAGPAVDQDLGSGDRLDEPGCPLLLGLAGPRLAAARALASPVRARVEQGRALDPGPTLAIEAPSERVDVIGTGHVWSVPSRWPRRARVPCR
jgi:hypothetical protein